MIHCDAEETSSKGSTFTITKIRQCFFFCVKSLTQVLGDWLFVLDWILAALLFDPQFRLDS